MGTTPIKTQTLLAAVILLAIFEFLAATIAEGSNMMPMAYLGIVRLIETVMLLWVVSRQKAGFGIIGLDHRRVLQGITTGLWWSLTFAIIALVGLGTLYLLNFQPLDLIRMTLPQMNRDLIFFFAVGGLIAPMAEEIFFRGILFGYFTRWNTVAAVFLSSLIFVLFHPQGGLTQAVGGVVFALAYIQTRSLMTPIVIHSLGNLALFSISLLTRIL